MKQVELKLIPMMCYDTKPIQSTCITFFDEIEGNADSITEETEQEIVNFLFSKNTSLRGFILEQIEPNLAYSNDVKVYCEVTYPFLKASEGDIDVLICNENYPNLGYAIQVKKIKAQADPDHYDKAIVNGVTKIKKLVQQGNKYQKYCGFYKSYVMIVILDDSRKDKTPNIMLRSTKHTETNKIYTLQWSGDLDERIGIIVVALHQTSDLSVALRGSLSCSIERQAYPQQQKEETTNKMKEVLTTKISI